VALRNNHSGPHETNHRGLVSNAPPVAVSIDFQLREAYPSVQISGECPKAYFNPPGALSP
jgi:hypothetical protein